MIVQWRVYPASHCRNPLAIPLLTHTLLLANHVVTVTTAASRMKKLLWGCQPVCRHATGESPGVCLSLQNTRAVRTQMHMRMHTHTQPHTHTHMINMCVHIDTRARAYAHSHLPEGHRCVHKLWFSVLITMPSRGEIYPLHRTLSLLHMLSWLVLILNKLRWLH